MYKYSTDALMKTVFKALTKDMELALRMEGHLTYCQDALISRTRQLLPNHGADAKTFKWFAQMSSFLKRYTFQDDPITPTEREQKTNDKFINLQISLAEIYGRRRSIRLHKVLSRARFHARRILDGFSPEDSFEEGRFGTKATIGCPAACAYIDTKLTDKPITGSDIHLQWFKNDYCANDPLLAGIIASNPRGFQHVRKLQQVNVPKKYNIDRGINPNSLIGSLYTDCLGKMLGRALRKEGLDIRKLQQKHRMLVEKASITRKTVTADLSDASHGFLSHHLNALLPRKWYRACMFGVIREVEVGQSVSRLESIMTMGIGFTFPMQTLLFYCLLLSLSDLTGIKGLISVYGDDLLYPRKLHPYVVDIFTEMGFKLNLDKTFVNSHFRESCGSDFFKGVDIRPFAPEGTSESLNKAAYAAFCYKLINGFRRRWKDTEIKTVLNTLYFEVCFVKECLFLVPPYAGDFAGVKVKDEESLVEQISAMTWMFPVPPLIFNQDLQTELHGYSRIQIKARQRYVSNHSPYYWDWLRSRVNYSPETFAFRVFDLETNTILTSEEISDASLDPSFPSKGVFKWRSKKDSNGRILYRTVRHGKGVKRVRQRHACVDDLSNKARYVVTFARVCIPHTEER